MAPSPPLPRRKTQAHPPDIREQAKVCRLAGMSQEATCAKLGLKINSLRSWEHRGSWPTQERIELEALRLRASIGAQKQESGKKEEISVSAIKREQFAIGRAEGLELIQIRAKQLVEIGETTAFGVAEHVARLIKSSFQRDDIPAPDSLESLATAFKMVERATGREAKNQAISSVTVQLSPYASGIVGELNPTTITLEAGDSAPESPNWLQIANDDDDGS